MIDVIVKVGGGLLAHPTEFERALVTIAEGATKRRILIVPGGGPFADAVRRTYQEMSVSEDAAHWMAVLAMDQYAYLIASRLRAGCVEHSPTQIEALIDHGRIPVLAPSSWLRRVDPLPHDWSVTSDSIAAWIAGSIGAGHLILVKPPGASGPSLVDAHFAHALRAGIRHSIIPADQIDVLTSAISGRDSVT